MRNGFLLALLMTACSHGAHGIHAPAAQQSPAAPISSCSPGSPADPFIIDWPADKRGDVELALKRGVIAAKVTCDRVEILADCQVAGEYLYAGVTEREEVISLKDTEDLRSQLPLSGDALSARMQRDFARGATLDVALASVGRKTSSVRRVLRSDLRGECQGATHFIRSAVIGAFAMQTGTRGKAKSAADLFDLGKGAPPGSTEATNRDGSIDACRTSPPDADRAQQNCSSPLRLALKPIADGPIDPAESAIEADPSQHACPSGSATNDGGQCVKKASNAPHLCDFKDPAECKVQCDRGSMGSCAVLGRNYQIGRGVAQDLKKGADLLVRACKGGAAPACSRIGEMLLTSAEREGEGLRLLQKACSDGWGEACTIAGAHLAKTRNTKVDVVALLRRACSIGDAEGCWTLGSVFETGLGVPKNDAEALHYLKLGCDGGARLGCVSYAKAIENGRGIAADAAHAVGILQNACDHGYSASCGAVSSNFLLGNGVDRDQTRGIDFLERACEGTDAGSCVTLGMRYERGVGVSTDKAKAARYYTRACESGLTVSCTQAQTLGKGP